MPQLSSLPSRRRLVVGGLGALGLSAGCSSDPVPAPTASPSPTGTRSATPTSRPTVTPTRSATPSARPSTTPSRSAGRPSLVGDLANAWAFAPLSDPGRITLEGSVPSQRAWSTSKVLVVAAYLKTVQGGDPKRLSASRAQLIHLALTQSDANAYRSLKYAIPGGSTGPITSILRSVGDTTTWIPSGGINGNTPWKIRQQVMFMAALHAGRVVNPAVSAYILGHMHPIRSQSWGLGTVGASAFKGGWVSRSTETRQMGILGGYAVAIITRGVGPAVLQSDGDSAHVEQMNLLAGRLAERLGVR